MIEDSREVESARRKLALLRKAWRRRAFAPDTLFLLSADDAHKFLDEGLSAGLALAGVEGFRITDAGAYQPCQEFSNDVAAWMGTADDFLMETKQLLHSGAKEGVSFQVIFNEVG